MNKSLLRIHDMKAGQFAKILEHNLSTRFNKNDIIFCYHSDTSDVDDCQIKVVNLTNPKPGENCWDNIVCAWYNYRVRIVPPGLTIQITISK